MPMTGLRPGPYPWPPLCPWLPTDIDATARAICYRAHQEIGICERLSSGVWSNRSPAIDEYNARAGAPPGSYWCASWATAVWEDAGAAVPPSGRASCDVLMAWAKKRGAWSATPAYGALVLYGVPGDAEHVGVVTRLSPVVAGCEGNTTEGGYSRNGVAVSFKPVNLPRVLGYALPTRA